MNAPPAKPRPHSPPRHPGAPEKLPDPPPFKTSPLRSDLQLECDLTAFYIDSTATPHKAIMTGRFFLLRQRPTQTQLLADVPFTATSPVPTDSPAAFAQALAQSWRQVLTDLTDRLETPPPPPGHQP